MTWVVDVSVAVAWCFEDEVTPRTEALLDRTENDPVVVPLHWPLEVTNVLRSAVRRGCFSETKAAEKVSALMSLPVRYDSLTHQQAFSGTWQICRKYKLTSYDAAYLELAVRLNAPLATNDEELMQAARKAGVPLL